MPENGSKLFQGRFRLDIIRKHFFTKSGETLELASEMMVDAPGMSVFRGIWILPLIICLNNVSALKWSGS